jgi:hypothetical protein
MTIAEMWETLEAEVDSLGPEEWLARRLAPASGCDLRIAIDRATRSRTVLIRLESAPLGRADECPNGRGFDVRYASFPGDGKQHKTLAVVLTDRAFLDIFSVLAQDLTNTLSATLNSRNVVAELFARLRSWQRFMECASPDGLGPSLQSGLYGELYFLRHHLLPLIGIIAGLDAWHGPSRLSQDFQFVRCAVEVKTSTSKQHQVIQIANERQLDESLLDKLFLFYLSLDSRPHQGETLVEMVSQIWNAIGNSDAGRELFSRKLLEAGYVDAQSHRYRNVGYSIRESGVFDVQGDFPRIVEGDLRDGVGDVTYSISVDECKHYAAAVDQMLTAIKGTFDGR